MRQVLRPGTGERTENKIKISVLKEIVPCFSNLESNFITMKCRPLHKQAFLFIGSRLYRPIFSK